MNFSKQLNYYIQQLNCSLKDLSISSGISNATISRYSRGERIPSLKNSHIENLAKGIAKLASDKGIANITEETVITNFSIALNYTPIDFEQFRKNFNELITLLSINIAKLAKSLNFDASYISKIRTGKRTPANAELFIDSLCNYIVHKYSSNESKQSIVALLNCSIKDISTDSLYFKNLKFWLSQVSSNNTNNEITIFLQKLDDFNLNEYIKVIHFDELKIPNIPFYKSTSKTYYGIEKMKQGELDFFKSTVLSKSLEDVFMCSDMPLADMAKDVEFGKKWMFAIAMTIKKGLHLNIIHNIDRPFNEMMLGLESWIPIYMTGQVSPYYFKISNNSIYCNLNYVSGKVALYGECLQGAHNDGRYHLTSSMDDVNYYRNKTNLLLKKANPLMDIYTVNQKNQFSNFLLNNSKTIGTRKRFLASLPIHTISNELLLKILKRNNLTENEIEKILVNVSKEKEIVNNILKNNHINDKMQIFSDCDIKNSKVNLFLANTFCEKHISYTHEEYVEHLNLTKQYAEQTSNYTFELNSQNIFKNIQIYIQEDNCVIISKNTDPSIHFVIKHQKLRNAIENFIAPVIEI